MIFGFNPSRAYTKILPRILTYYQCSTLLRCQFSWICFKGCIASFNILLYLQHVKRLVVSDMVLYKPILVLILAQPEQIPHLLCFKVSQVSQVRQFNNKTCRFNSCGWLGLVTNQIIKPSYKMITLTIFFNGEKKGWVSNQIITPF